jgi:type IV secretion system protein TrbD
MSLRVTPIYRAGHRANLLLGADRRLLMVVAFICIALFLSFTIPGLIAAPLVWWGSLALLRKAAAFDPHLRVVYWRYLWQKPFYPARSTPHRIHKIPVSTTWT